MSEVLLDNSKNVLQTCMILRIFSMQYIQINHILFHYHSIQYLSFMTMNNISIVRFISTLYQLFKQLTNIYS